MIAIARYLFPFICFALFSRISSAQIDTAVLKSFVPVFRHQLFHDEVKKEQKNILKYDGKDDDRLTVSSNGEINYLINYAIKWKVASILYKIEMDSSLADQKKVLYIRRTATLLSNLQKSWKTKQADPMNLPAVLNAYEDCINLDEKGINAKDYFESLPYEIGNSVFLSGAFDNNPGYKDIRNLLLRKYCALHPKQTFRVLTENPGVPFADSLIKVVSKKYPELLYDYAQAGNKLGYIISSIKDDPFVVAVVRMAKNKSGRLYYPFLGNIVAGRTTFEAIDSVRNDSIAYYRMLVKTRMDYVSRAINKDTAYGFRDLGKMLETKATDVFVNTINGLHEVDDPNIRFRIIQTLTAEELYYLAVYTDGIIYTSSFVNGVYPLMMKRINKRGDSLLLSVKFDKYRKFIKMAAGYNTLGNFLGSFPSHDDATVLMRAFVSGLESSSGLEDGVDVADSYASISETMKPVANEMLKNVRLNYERNKAAGNKRGTVMYDLLYKLFLSADSTNKIDLSKEFGIPPIYNVPYKLLANDSGRVIMEVFFYGDKDGQNIFEGFKKMFNPALWKIDNSNPEWITISSIKGKPVTIFSNKPLPEESGEDEKAQKDLTDYLEKTKLNPTITIHRGHSYYAESTIDQMFPSSKIVFLGSCGGYHLINDVLKKAPDAHIIASKQIGKTAINRPFFELLMETVRNGKDIEWIPFWQDLEKKVKVEGFEDYIPPYKNLGALFIKAYKIAMGGNEDDEQ
ncbi:MAG: hypothetical protein IT214_05015 [Chitinophagaceae bacterium]|jgi:hypothetical protein|nr:hypothetical protein [Chitinophagaceae bacterium]OQY96447.1 MAG: hypothetical protein B6D37_02815 [Sphingobacteriales bacterium UTBCD1]